MHKSYRASQQGRPLRIHSQKAESLIFIKVRTGTAIGDTRKGRWCHWYGKGRRWLALFRQRAAKAELQDVCRIALEGKAEQRRTSGGNACLFDKRSWVCLRFSGASSCSDAKTMRSCRQACHWSGCSGGLPRQWPEGAPLLLALLSREPNSGHEGRHAAFSRSKLEAAHKAREPTA